MNELRKNCPMRHAENGNCISAGGFCTAVNDSICEALHNAYDCGKRTFLTALIEICEQQGYITIDDILGVLED